SEPESYVVAHRPVVVLAFDRNNLRMTLRMALDTGIVHRKRIHCARIKNVGTSWMLNMLAPRAVATLTAYIPLGHQLGVNVIVDGVASVTGWPRRTLHIVIGIKGSPPIGSSRWHLVWTP